jgi:hypothetical protein
MADLDLIAEALESSCKLGAVDRPAQHLCPEHLLGRERPPLAIGPLRRVDHDRMRVKLGIKFPARVVGETRDDPAASRFDRALAFLLGAGPRRGGFKVSERLGDRPVVRLTDPDVVAHQGQQ